MSEIYGFPPVADERARVLILGTMPSVRSLEEGRYYGHPQNAFWRIVFALWNRPLPPDYDARRAFLLEKRIALWDVLSRCAREGSADSAIRDPRPGDFAGLYRRCPALRAVFFNSHNAARFYDRLVVPDPLAALPKTVLPSTSPARAMSFEKKLALWAPLREAVGDEAG